MDFIGLPRPLVVKLNELAAKKGTTPEELVRDAVETRLSREEWVRTLEFGDRNARGRGLTAEDVDAQIVAVRAEPTQ